MRAGGGYKYIGKSRTTSYADKKVMTGTKYYYKLQGVYKMACGHFNYIRISSCKSGRTTLRAIKLKGKAEKRKVRLCWKKVRGANGYIICRANRKSGRYKIIKTTKGNSKLKYTDSRLKKGGTYCYKVKAYRAVSSKRIKSVYSNTVKVKAR